MFHVIKEVKMYQEYFHTKTKEKLFMRMDNIMNELRFFILINCYHLEALIILYSFVIFQENFIRKKRSNYSIATFFHAI